MLGRLLLVARDGSAFDDKSSRGNDIIARAIHAGATIVGIATNPRHHLPRDLVRAREFEIAMPNLDAAAISLVVEAVTGKIPATAMDESLVRACEVSDLSLRDPPGSVAGDLHRAAAANHRKEEADRSRRPHSRRAFGYGDAKIWGLELAADIREYRAGRLAWDQIADKNVLIAGPSGIGKKQAGLRGGKECGSRAGGHVGRHLEFAAVFIRNALMHSRCVFQG